MKYFLSGVSQGMLAGAVITGMVFFSIIRATSPTPKSVIFDAVMFEPHPSVAASFSNDNYTQEELQQLWGLFRLVMKEISGCSDCDDKKLQEISSYFSKQGWERFLTRREAEPLLIMPSSSWPQVILSPEEVDGVKCHVFMLDYNSPQQSKDEAKNTPSYRIKLFLRFDAAYGSLPLIEDILWEKVHYGRK
ncbi:MAG: hypothetical protein HND56_09795 [Pseudomonadota bacterium]|nr:hypothetical protein [Pseudomonadota bacterium]QKK05963.1 MAG: hypothetical protein HND56_09795 [Pseudomonadota bacterium]